MKFLRPPLALLAAVTISAAAMAQTPAPAPSASAAPASVQVKQPGKWAQDYLDREADPDVRFGTLPNGLRYAIMKNDTPKEAVSMRMVIGSGALEERDEERGLAHFLEHMAFRGSDNVADGEVVRMLERHGLRFGPDTNASTGFDRTIYMFNFPRATEAAVEDGLMLFREIGARLKLDPAAVEAEKGVVLSEERIRDTPQLKAAKANIALLFQGTKVPDRLPIGTIETVSAATPERLRRYYEANYRPDNATVIVVGAIDPAEIEAKIKARFSDWQPKGPADAAYSATAKPVEKAREFVASGAPDELSLNWVGAKDQRAETLAVDVERLARSLGISVLNNRLGDLALKPGNPFAAASAGVSDSLYGTISVVALSIRADPSKWRPALDAALTEQRVLLRDGVSADELKRAANSMLANYQAQADGASTRRSENLADGLVSAAEDGALYTSPQQDLALVQRVVAGATPELVTAALRNIFSRSEPLVFRSARSDPATTDAIESALAQLQAKPLPAAQAQVAATWPYDDFGAAGRIASRTQDEALGITTVTFANGTRLVVKPTDLEKDRITILMNFGQGQAGVPDALTHATWATSVFPAGGMGKVTVPQLRNYMQTQGKLGGMQPSLSTRRLVLTGATRPADFAFEMQMLTAFATDPGFRPEMADQLNTVEPMLKTQIDTNAGAVFSRGLTDLLNGGDQRFSATPTDAEIDATKAADLPALLRPMLATPADVVVVGDISVDDAIAATASTIGAVARQARPAEPAPQVSMPAGSEAPHVFLHGGRADQAYYGLVWPMPDFLADPRLAHVADVAAALVKARLVDTVREKLGLTYSPNAGAAASAELRGLGYFSVQTETPPDKFDQMHAAVMEVIDDLAAKPVEADELDRARKPLVEAAQKQRETNSFWASSLSLALREPRMREELLNGPEVIGSVTAQEAQAMLKAYVAGKTPITAISRARGEN